MYIHTCVYIHTLPHFPCLTFREQKMEGPATSAPWLPLQNHFLALPPPQLWLIASLLPERVLKTRGFLTVPLDSHWPSLYDFLTPSPQNDLPLPKPLVPLCSKQALLQELHNPLLILHHYVWDFQSKTEIKRLQHRQTKAAIGAGFVI